MTSAGGDDDIAECAACGRGGDGLKWCNACRTVKYCGAACQRAHWPGHKKACRKRAAELFDERLFATPPPSRGECPVCFLLLPICTSERKWQSCCGKVICAACNLAVAKEHHERAGPDLWNCPFCRGQQGQLYGQYFQQIQKRMEANDASAYYTMGTKYATGNDGLEQDQKKAMELWKKAGELGSDEAYHNMGMAYMQGTGVRRDMKKAISYCQKAAMAGNERSRHMLGEMELTEGSIAGGIFHVDTLTRAKRHFMISAAAGLDSSLEKIKFFFSRGYATKEEFERTLRAHKDSADAMWSEMREQYARLAAEHS